MLRCRWRLSCQRCATLFPVFPVVQKLFRQYAFLFFYERTLGRSIDLPELYSIAVIPLACVPLDRKGYNIFMTDIWEQFVFLPVSAAAAAVSSFLLVYIREYFVYKVACFDTGCPGFQGILIKKPDSFGPGFSIDILYFVVTRTHRTLRVRFPACCLFRLLPLCIPSGQPVPFSGKGRNHRNIPPAHP